MSPSRAQSRRKPARRLLQLIAGCGPRGIPEAIMKAHGLSVDDLVELVRAGLAERVVAGTCELQVTRVRITDAGRRLLEVARR